MRKTTMCVVLGMAVSVACGGDDGPPDPPVPDGLTAVVTIPAAPNRALDLLLVVDDSGGTIQQQTALRETLTPFINVINTAVGGLPDVHIGVVTANVGTGGVEIGGCSTATAPEGDDGAFQTNSCPGLQAAYVEDLKNADGTRRRNYSGDLSALLGCMVNLGSTGCGFEAPLESMKRALSPGRNPGFLRPDAVLGVLILTDEDDCSALPGGALFGDPNASNTSPLGPRTSFRCFEFGVQCDDDPDPRAFGTKTGCVPRVDSPYMPTVQPYVDFLRGLKASPSAVVVSGLIGDVDAQRSAVVAADAGDATRPALYGSCSSIRGEAAPGLRLRSFLDGFADRGLGSSICADTLIPAVETFAERLLSALGSPCITQTLADVDAATPGLQPRCEVTQYTLTSGTRTDPVTIPACTVDGTLPCWQLDDALAECSFSSADQALVIARDGAAPAGTEIEARCQVAS